MTSQEVALQVMQQTISVLRKWVDAQFCFECQPAEEHLAVTKAKKILLWQEQEPNHLQLLFDAVKFDDSKERKDNNYCPVEAIADSEPSIPYPVKEAPDLTEYKQTIKTELENIDLQDWENLSLLTLITEKYGSCLSFIESDVALIDMARSTAAVACAIARNPEADNICLIAGDLSGIQKFIYTISSDGALKSLRARSFYLELVSEEIVQQLLERLDLPRTSIIYAGGGNLYLLAPHLSKNLEKTIIQIRDRFNDWLKITFQGQVFLALDYLSLPVEVVGTSEFAKYWKQTPQILLKQKHRKFDSQLDRFLTPNLSYPPCRVCHRDDLPSLKPLNHIELDSSPACWMCRTMFALGDKLPNIKAVVRSKKSSLNRKFKTGERLSFPGSYYYLFETTDLAVTVTSGEIVFLINNWQLDRYYQDNTVPLLLGKYGQTIKTEEGAHFIRAGEMAQFAQEAGCIPRVGYLRMDVDKLGKIFANGLGDKQTLPRLAGLSRQMSYFFKVYLNSLAEDRQKNFITPIKTGEALKNAKYLTEEERKNLLFIYAGGDDLFVSGAWNEIVEFAFDTYQSFREYTGWNQDITISGGISINDIKYPLYQAANRCGDAEEASKGNGRDSLGLFGEVFKWEEWVNIATLVENKSKVFDYQKERYLAREAKPEISDVLSFVQILTNKLDINSDYSRSFIRRLLDAAGTQEQILKQMDKDREKEENKNGVRYYLHLPKLAYALSRLPKSLHDDKDFIVVRQSLMNPRNAPYFRAIATWIELLTRSR
ncbi:type III-A CRISPR-associated protein Cas10/Csm1 [Microcoleus sp. F4-D5]|uniref:type III-A CRISPR-associated protein Cas10/Csm1 n=1 Tax=Microcoleus sp. F4-D5 TaxID=2818760 RepID=UPI002FD60D84